MTAVLEVTVPIYLLIVAGFAAVRSGYLGAEVVRALGTFVIRICIPAMIFSAVAEPGGEALNWAFIAAYGGASLVVFATGLAVMRAARRRPLAESTISALGMANSNSGFMGFPIAAHVIGAEAVSILAWAMVFENMVLIPLALAIADAGAFPEERFPAALARALRALPRNPILIGLALGLAVNLTGMPVPGVLDRFLGFLVQAAPVVALFVVGGTVAAFPLRGLALDTGLIALGKLVLHPALAFVALSLIPGLDPALLLGGVLFASVPMLSIFPIFGQRYGIESLTAATLVFTTTLSFATVSLLILTFG
jgi:predicted permease